MKLLTTCIFLIVSLVMMNSSFAQDDADLIAAIKEQTAAIKEQTVAIKEQTITMKVIALNNSGFNLGGTWERIRNDYLAIDNITEKIIERQARFEEE